MENAPEVSSGEVWRPVSNFDNKYFVSSLGRVKNHKGHIMATGLDKYGYVRVYLYKNNKNYTCNVHRLVAKEFLQNSDNKTQVNHIDGDKTNNRVSNLEYATPKENMWHKIYVLKNRHTLLGKICPVECIETGTKYPSTREASRKSGVDNSILCKCLANGKADNYGHHWKKIVSY